MENKQSYEERKAEIKEEQATMSIEEVKEAMTSKSEYMLDLNSLPKQEHNWVDRGAKMSCEGANHAHHSHFKVKR